MNEEKSHKVENHNNKAITERFSKHSFEKWSKQLPVSWQKVLEDYPNHLSKLKYVAVSAALYGALHFIRSIDKAPKEVTKDDLRNISNQHSIRDFLSHLCLYMSAEKQWPKSFLRNSASGGIITRAKTRKALNGKSNSKNFVNTAGNTRSTRKQK